MQIGGASLDPGECGRVEKIAPNCPDPEFVIIGGDFATCLACIDYCLNCAGAQSDASVSGKCSLQAADADTFDWVYDTFDSGACQWRWSTEIGGVPVLNGELLVSYDDATDKWLVSVSYDAGGGHGAVAFENNDAPIVCSGGSLSGTFNVTSTDAGCEGETLSITL